MCVSEKGRRVGGVGRGMGQERRQQHMLMKHVEEWCKAVAALSGGNMEDLWKGHLEQIRVEGPPRVSVDTPSVQFRVVGVGGAELIIRAVKPSQSLSSLSNEVPDIRAL